MASSIPVERSLSWRRCQLVLAGALLPILLAANPDSPRPEEKPVLRLDPFSVWGSPMPRLSGLSGLTVATPIETPTAHLRETLSRIPGLLIQESFGGFDPPRFSVRGSGLQSAPVSRGVVLSLNEFPLNFADGSFDLALIEGGWLEYAELTPGPGAGVPALGGALAMWSNAGLFTGDRLASVSYGSDRSVTVSTQGSRTDQRVRPAWAAAVSRSDGWRDHSGQARESLLAAIRGPLAGDTEFTVQLHAVRPRFDVPGPLTKQTARDDPRSNSPLVRRDQPRRETDYVQLGGILQRRGDDRSLHLGATLAYHEDCFRQLAPNGIQETSALNASFFGGMRQVWEGDLHQYTDLGLRGQYGRWDAQRYRNDAGSRGTLMGDNRLEPLTLTLLLDHRLALADRQTLEVGSSLLGARRKIGERFDRSGSRPSTAADLSGIKLAPRVSWNWRPAEPVTLSVSWARSYEPPTFDDLFFTTGPMEARELQTTSLAWQRADTFEIGLSAALGRWAWTSRAYYAPWRRELLRLADADGAPRGTVNARETLHMGWESLVEWRVLESPDMEWNFWATYHLSEVRFDDDPVYGDSRIAGVPPHSGAVGLRGDLSGGWFIGPGLHWQTGPTYADHGNQLSFGGFAVWSLEVGRKHPAGWEMGVRVRNLFDRRYIASTAGVLDRARQPESTAIFLPGTGRRVEAHFSYGW